MRNRFRRALRSLIAANGLFDRKLALPIGSLTAVLGEVKGLIEQVDPVSRELRVSADGRTAIVYVPLDCRVSLGGEPVKLRLLQRGDRAEVVYSLEQGVVVAQSIAATWTGVPHENDRPFGSEVVTAARSLPEPVSAG